MIYFIIAAKLVILQMKKANKPESFITDLKKRQ